MSNLVRSGVNHVARKHRVPNALTLFNKMFIPPGDRATFKFLLHARSKAFFFAVVEIIHPKESPGCKLIAKAYRVLHHEYGKARRQSGEREAEHPTRVAMMAMLLGDVWDADKIAALLLHDMIEKFRGKWSIERISHEFNATVGRLVGFLTKPVQSGKLIRDAVLERAYRLQLRKGGRDVIELKAFDVIDNLLTLWGRSDNRMERKVVDVAINLLPLMRHFRIGFAEYIDRVLEYILHSIKPPTHKNKRTA